jgi:hypothetical protein
MFNKAHCKRGLRVRKCKIMPDINHIRTFNTNYSRLAQSLKCPFKCEGVRQKIFVECTIDFEQNDDITLFAPCLSETFSFLEFNFHRGGGGAFDQLE